MGNFWNFKIGLFCAQLETTRFQCSSVAQSCPIHCHPWNKVHQATLYITNSRSPPKTMSIESVLPSNHIILCCPLLLLPSMFPSITVFSNESVLRITWPTYWSCSFNISPSNEYPGLISFMMDWLDLLAVIQSGSKYHSKWKWSLWFHLFHRVKCLRHNTLHFFFFNSSCLFMVWTTASSYFLWKKNTSTRKNKECLPWLYLHSNYTNNFFE